MKKSILMFSMASLLLVGGLNVAFAQEQPKPKKDTVNIDTDAKPTFYYAEDEASKSKRGFVDYCYHSRSCSYCCCRQHFFVKEKEGNS